MRNTAALHTYPLNRAIPEALVLLLAEIRVVDLSEPRAIEDALSSVSGRGRRYGAIENCLRLRKPLNVLHRDRIDDVDLRLCETADCIGRCRQLFIAKATGRIAHMNIERFVHGFLSIRTDVRILHDDVGGVGLVLDDRECGGKSEAGT